MLSAPVTADSLVHGKVYDWSTFEAIDVAVVQVNTTPIQKSVTANGSYAFYVPAGDYALMAEARGPTGPMSAQENITVPSTGDFVIDLLLFPADDLAILRDLNESLPETVDEGASDGQWWALPALAGLAAAVLLIGGGAYLVLKYTHSRSRTPQEPMTAVTGATPVPVSIDSTGRVLRQDCKDVMAAIAKNGGRMTQLDLRKTLPYSEAKISLIVSELEDAGLLRKIKKGRGNVLILTGVGNDGQYAGELPAADKEKEGK